VALEGAAKVEIDVLGADRAAAAARSALSPWGEYADKAKEKFRGFRQEVGGAIGSVVSDLGRVITVGSTISFAGAVQSVQSFEKATAQLAVATRQPLEQIRTQFEDIGQKMGMKPEAVASYVTGVGRITYNFNEAQRNLGAFKNAAADWNRPLEGMAGLQVAINKLGFKDAEKALAQIRANAESLKTVGGPAALADQVERLSGVWDRVKGGGGSGSIALTGLIGNGLNPQQQQRAQQQILGDFTSDTIGWERFLRRTGQLGRNERVTDDSGQIKNLPEYIAKIQRGYMKVSGGNKDQMAWLAGLHFGDTITGSAFANMDPEKLARLAKEQSASDAQARLNATDAGRRDVNAVKRAGKERGLFGSDTFLGGLAKMYDEFSAENPIAGKGVELGIAGAAGWLGKAMMGRKAVAAAEGAAAASKLAPAARALRVGGRFGLARSLGFGELLAEGLGLTLGNATAPINQKARQIEGETAGALQTMREGRVAAIVRAAERSGGTSEGYMRELGKPLLAQIAHDPQLQTVAAGMANGSVDLSRLAPGLAEAFTSALSKSPLKVHVEIIDSTSAGVDAAQSDFNASGTSGNQ